ncbi:MAG: DUF2849 domain-containing protein [Sphingomonadales bacterium]
MSAGHILTANLLLTGDVVFLTPAGDWSVRADEARFAETEDDVAVLKAAEAKAVAANIVVSTEIIGAEKTQVGVWPTRNREQIRAKGPTVHEAFGNQARFDLSAFEGA